MAKPSKSQAFFSATQVAAVLGVDSRTVRHHCVRGAFPGAFMMGKTWVIPAAGFEHFKANRPKVGHPKSPQKPAKNGRRKKS